MEKFSLFCKSYRPDLQAVCTLTDSVRAFNAERLDFVLCVPQADLALFQSRIGKEGLRWVTDETIIELTGHENLARYERTPGTFSQQVVKSEYWRMGLTENFLCLDSDCRFIREFRETDFIAPDGIPYTVLHEGKPFRQFCRSHGLNRAVDDIDREKSLARKIFGRNGPPYDFGPAPPVWNRAVWQSLHEEFLDPKGISMFDAVEMGPIELTWYGEALLNFRAIPLHAREPFFKAYLHLEEYECDRRDGIDISVLAKDYFGVVYQSNWYPKRLQLHKRYAYKLKKYLRHLRGK